MYIKLIYKELVDNFRFGVYVVYISYMQEEYQSKKPKSGMNQ